jgi:predicted Ser/Thr protein kinase
MTDDRRRAGGTAPPSAEPGPGETLPYAPVLGPRSEPPRAPHPLAVASGPQAQAPHPLAVASGPQAQAPQSSLALQQTEWQAPQQTPLQQTPLQQTPLRPHASHPHTPVQHTPYEVLELPRASAPPPSAMPAGSMPPDSGRRAPKRVSELPYAPTMTPAQLEGETLDILSPAKRSSPPADGTLDLPASDRVDAAPSLDPGQKLGRFVIRSQLGEGGMGIVLAGHDAKLGRPVAIKLVKPDVDRPAYRARLLREAQALARLEHPNVVRVYEVGSDRGRLFVAMELVDGVTLSEWLRAKRRPWREIVAMFEQVGAGLAAVHRAGLIHRDFKPDNVLVDRQGHARVADFGLARLDPERGVATAGSPELAAALTRSGVMMGTPGYMAPEQQFSGTVDTRADQYSFCVALREALAGSRTAKLDAASWGEVPHVIREVIARGCRMR